MKFKKYDFVKTPYSGIQIVCGYEENKVLVTRVSGDADMNDLINYEMGYYGMSFDLYEEYELTLINTE